MSKELACRFGPYVPEKPNEAQQQRGDAAAAAAADIERWVLEHLRPMGSDHKAVNSYKSELRAVAMEKLGRTSQGFKIFSLEPEKICAQLVKHLPRQALIELASLLVKEVQK